MVRPKDKGCITLEDCLWEERTKGVKEKVWTPRKGPGSLGTLRSWGNRNNVVIDRPGFYSGRFNLLTVGPWSVSSCKDGDWIRLALKEPLSPEILFILSRNLESGS